MPLYDTHCHLTSAKFASDRDAVIARAVDAGVARMLCIGTGCDDALQVASLARAHPATLHAAAGIDPFSAHEAGDRFADDLARLTEILTDPLWRALGEIGLDYHHRQDPPAVQQERLVAQLALAQRLGLPVILHCRDAHQDMQAILREHRDLRGVVHCFSAGPEVASGYLEQGWYLAFGGMTTHPQAAAVRAAAAMVPQDRLLLETDCPYLAPQPVRGRRCEPAHLVHVAEALAALRGQDPAIFAEMTSANACRMFTSRPDPDQVLRS